MIFPFGDFLPDQPEFGMEGLTDALNVYPAKVGYRPVGDFVAHTDALPDRCRGAWTFVAPSGRVVVIAGTETAVYRLNGLAWVEIASGYSTPENGRWRFVQFGQLGIASNGVDAVIKIDLETDVVGPLGGGAPTMEAMTVVNNFVVGTKINGKVNIIGWSGENNAEWWTWAQRKSDYQEFADGGDITGIIGGEFGLVLQKNAVRRMSFVGGNILFRFDKISTNDGCATVHSVAQYGELAFWWSENGFKMWTGAQIRSIGFEKVDKSFNTKFGAISPNNLSTAIDGERYTVSWTTGNKVWIYNWLLDKWSVIDESVEILTSRDFRPPSLEEQDPIVGAPDDDVEGGGLVSFESTRFIRGGPAYFAFKDGVMGTFDGPNREATLIPRYAELLQGRDTRLRRVRPISDATDGFSLRVDAAQRLGDTPRRRDFTSLRNSGEMPVRQRGRFIRPSLTIEAGQDWSYVHGLDLTMEMGGRR